MTQDDTQNRADVSETDDTGVLDGLSRRSMLSSLGVGAAGLALGGVGTAAADESDQSNAQRFADGSSPTTTAISDGHWNEASTWDNGVPGDGQDARIDDGVTVRLGSTTSDVKTLDVTGTLAFDRTTDSDLRAETVVTRPGSTLHIGTESNPIQRGNTARLTFVHHEDISAKDDPKRVSKGLVVMGDFEVHGADTSGWHELSAAPTSGDNTLELAEAPTGWTAGDDVVVPGQNPDIDSPEDEARTIANVSGSTVTLDSALEYDHSPPDHGGDESLSAYALNLGRNVVFESEVQASDPTNEQRVNRQGHVMVMATNSSVHNARFIHVGRTNKRYYFTNNKYGEVPDSGRFVPDEPNPRKRYAFHYHETGIEDSASHEASGLAVQDSPGWGVVNHHSNADVSNSVSYRVLGAAFVTEGGDERGSFVGNFALRSHGSGQKIDERQAPQESAAAINDFGHAGHGFWLQGPAVAVEDNVAAGHRAYAFSLWNRALYDEDEFTVGDFVTHRGLAPNMPRDLAEADGLVSEARTGPTNESEISTAALKFKSVSDNAAFASAGGLDIANHNFVNPHGDESEFSQIEGFTAYNIAPWTDIDGDSGLHSRSGGNTWGEGGYVGIATRYSDNVRIVDATLVNDGDGWGVRRNFYPTSGAVLDSHIEGFDVGIHTLDSGESHIEGVTFDNESVNVEVRPIGHKEGYAIDMADLTFEGGQENVTMAYRPAAFLPQKFAWGERHHGAAHSYDGRRLYYDAQARDFVPFETERDVEAVYTDQAYNWSTVGPFDGIEDAKDEVVGKTNQQLKEQYGLCIYDELMPADAVSHPDIAGAKVEPVDDPNAGPTAAFSSSTDALTVSVDAGGSSDSDGAIASYEWAFGDGTTATGRSAGHTYDSGGDYDVTLTVTDGDGATDQATQTVSVAASNEGPTATFSTATDSLTVTCDASGSSDADGSISRHEWAFGDGTTATGRTADHSYESGGDYDVTLTVTDDDGATAQATQTVSVSEPVTQSAYNGPHTVPGRIQAEDFDTGGEGVAYNDTTDGNAGNVDYRDTDVDLGRGGTQGPGIGWIDPDEWWEYTVQVESSGTYEVRARVNGPQGATFALAVDGQQVLETSELDGDGSWGGYVTESVGTVDLEAGEHVIRVTATADSWNFDWLEFSEETDDNTESVTEAIDADDDGRIEDSEILQAMDYWQEGERVPDTGGETISDAEMLDLIDRWQDGE